jgi:hypothetical protein
VVGLAGAAVTGGAGIRLGLAETLTIAPRKMRERLPCLPIDVFAMFDGKHVQPLGTDTAIENAIGPDSVGPDLVLLKVTFQRFAIEGVLSEMTEGFFDSFSCRAVTTLEVFECLRCETDLPHCSSPNTALKE